MLKLLPVQFTYELTSINKYKFNNIYFINANIKHIRFYYRMNILVGIEHDIKRNIDVKLFNIILFKYNKITNFNKNNDLTI